MPGKHVHFASNYPDTPSPAFSSSTLPSSAGPITPPPMGFGSPYHYTPLPGNAIAHPALSVTKSPLIDYNLTQPPTSIIYLTSDIPFNFREQPATQPLFPSIEVTCQRLPWRITIHARTKSFVTVGDVLDGLYQSLRTNVTAAEFALLPSPEAQREVDAAYRLRCKHVDPQYYKSEMAKGVKRVDFLGRYSRFNGIVCTKDGMEARGWTMMVSFS